MGRGPEYRERREAGTGGGGVMDNINTIAMPSSRKSLNR